MDNTQAEALFNQNFAAIQQAKQQTGDWEKAFQMVTGAPWPKGQHIKVGPEGGRAEKDSSMWKKAANIGLMAAPIVAAPLTGGSSLALLGAGAGAARGALNGGGLKGAIMGGAMGAASGLGGKYIGSMLGKTGIPGIGGNVGTPPFVGNSSGSFLRDAVNGVGSKMVDGYGPDFVGPTLEQAGKSGGGSWISRLLGGAKNALVKGDGTAGADKPGQGWGDMSSVIGSYGNAEANNRKVRGDMTQDYDRINLDYSKENLNRESDAMRKLGQTSYIMGGGNPYVAPKLNSGQTVDLGYGPKAPSAAEQQGAGTLQKQLMGRLTPEGALKPTDPGYLNEGVGEKIAKYGALGTGIAGAARTIWG